ncbi:MAG: hypothetical protein H0A76_05675 [Candidatus Thiodubiliella endoseptemdiera]|uniref:Uncharacterized protein n=1 Tax=Candidatus Thiodubiliella endoseptemdiera TaxID=2738886 RepID=A0A853F1W9_9GAMM|nr:hypothetical protein [Candidatus Thiodubiliella endoseptemdiera]
MTTLFNGIDGISSSPTLADIEGWRPRFGGGEFKAPPKYIKIGTLTRL